jgi:hypothetical protein
MKTLIVAKWKSLIILWGFNIIIESKY